MKVWRSLADVPHGLRCPVFTVGNFDGVHAGHQQILEVLRQRAAETGGTPLVLTFDPHPLRILAPERAPRLLTPLSLKLELFEKAGVWGVLVQPFTLEFSQVTPERFAREILAGRLGSREVVVGDNFRFGYEHAGSARTLTELGQRFGFQVHAVAPVRLRRQTASSARIRRLLEEGRVSLANRLLGRCFSVRGRVVPGRGIGQAKTVPTLNLEEYGEMLPARGVYITETACDGVRSISVTNIGHAPTFTERALQVECFLLEATPSVGTEWMEVVFWRRLRDERKFPSPEALKAQILRDVSAARVFFRRLRKPQTV